MIRLEKIFVKTMTHQFGGGGERGGLVVESLIPEREVGGSIPTSAVLCP